MNDIPPLPHLSPIIGRIGIPHAAANRISAPSPQTGDRVEVSKAAQLLAKLAELPDVRQDLIDRVKTQIQRGSYETAGKLDTAVEALAQDL